MSYSSFAIVTGGSSGIGFECVKDLATAQPETLVVVASRVARLPPNTEFHALDLVSLDSVNDFVSWWPYGPISSLTCCAGVMLWTVTLRPDGIEDTFAINHIGHAALLFGLKRRNLLSPEARITFLSSSLHKPDNKSQTRPSWTTTDEVAHASTEKPKDGRTAYANSKLAVVTFANALAKRVEAAGGGWRVNTYDPGFVPGSNIARDAPLPIPFLFTYVMPWFAWALESRGAHTSTVDRSGKVLAEMAYADKYSDLRGAFVHVDKEDKSSDQSHEAAFQDDLWDWTVNYLKVEPEVAKF